MWLFLYDMWMSNEMSRYFERISHHTITLSYSLFHKINKQVHIYNPSAEQAALWATLRQQMVQARVVEEERSTKKIMNLVVHHFYAHLFLETRCRKSHPR